MARLKYMINNLESPILNLHQESAFEWEKKEAAHPWITERFQRYLKEIMNIIWALYIKP